MDASRLRRSRLFEGLSDADVERCADRFSEIELTAGSRLVNEGDYSYKFFVILEGEVEVRHDFDEVRRLGPGDFLGELGLLTDERRTAKVIALTRCTVAGMMIWDFRTMLTEHPEIAARVESAAAQYLEADQTAASLSDDVGEELPGVTDTP